MSEIVMKTVVHKGKKAVVEFELFKLLIKSWIDQGMTREEALDLFFSM